MSAPDTDRKPIHRLAIVNRGEAALRCIRAVKSLREREGSDLQAIALFTDVDRDAPFVRYADQAVELPMESGAVAAYLDHDTVMDALRRADADSVWPGWGFLAEDPSFVERVTEAGLVFLGPSASSMRSLGDKIAAKKLAEENGVAVTPWSGSALVDEDDAARHAEFIGFPMVVKASAGGGGRGIRVVQRPHEIKEAFRAARAEALAAFGDDRLFCEGFVREGRHIEVQIAADCEGNVLALGSRDCSVQRRHQKVIEEAPPPDLDLDRRAEMETAAVKLAQSVGYVGVGTVEFLLSTQGPQFLEINPRLQVEHGITEEITGLDLVELQIRIARGESIANLEVRERGVAIEARVCAEDPDAGFMPSPGSIALFDPSLGPRLRLDSGVSGGSTVPADFDSLIAKVIASGETREEARARLVCALRDFQLVVRGGATNKGYLLQLLESDAYRRGAVDTGWLDRWNQAREESDEVAGFGARDALVAAAILAYQRERAVTRLNFYSDTARITPERIPPAQGQEIDLSHLGESYRLKVYAIGSWRYRIHLDGKVVGATMREEGAQSARLIIDDRVHRIVFDPTDAGLRVEVDGQPYRFGWQTVGQVTAGTPAMVVAVHVEPGDRVEVAQPLGLLEAMKMEIGFQAPVTGVVTEVRARPGQQVAAGDLLLIIDPAGDENGQQEVRVRLQLPEQSDPLAPLFRATEGNLLADPDLAAADLVEDTTRQRAMAAVRDEIRRVLLGYDANPERGDRLVAFLDAALAENLSETFRWQLAEIRHELAVFADLEELFIRAPRASVSGELGPSNNARFRMYVRRLRAEGAGIVEEFLDLLRRALFHFDVHDLTPTDSLERAVLRLFACQLDPRLRQQLVLGMLHRIGALAESGLALAPDPEFSDVLLRIARMRGLLPDTIADAATEAHYLIFERPELERQAEQRSRDLEEWLANAEWEPAAHSSSLLLDLAAGARRVFDRVGRWVAWSNANRGDIALAAHVQRVYSPCVPAGRRLLTMQGTRVHCTDYPERGLVLAAIAGAEEIAVVAEHLCRAAEDVSARVQADSLYALELTVLKGEEVDGEELAESLGPQLKGLGLNARFTVSLLAERGDHVYLSFARVGDRVERLHPNLDIHPEIAQRIDLGRFEAFDLERLSSEEGIYCFHGRSRDASGDERIFVLADVQSGLPTAGHEASIHMAAFERAFYQATRSLRGVLQLRDPRRRMQWNRISLFVAPALFLDAETVNALSSRLAPATRHLGLEKVLVGVRLLDRNEPDGPVIERELVISEATGEQMELTWREPHHEPLRPAQEYERNVVAARRRRLVYPYEIVRMLSRGGEGTSGSGTDELIPKGQFEEFEIEYREGRATAISVGGRAYGRNEAGIVFGIISTPTGKVPEGMRRVLILSDPNRGMGALAVPECDRIIAAINLAEHEGIPVEWVPVSAGAAIAMDSGTENLDATARVVRRIVTFTQGGGVIHLIVSGINVGAQSYFDALATMMMHTRGVLIMTPGASMVLTGRMALEAAGAVSAEDEVAIGGFERIMGPNGEAQYYARNLSDAYRMLYEHYLYSYVAPGELMPRRFTTTDPRDRSICDYPVPAENGFDFSTVGEIFDDETNPGRKRPFSMRAVMTALIDQDGGQLERWRSMVGAETAIIWDAHLGGVPISLVGIESHTVPREGYRPTDGPEAWTGGTLFPLSSKKVARAIRAASGNRPTIVLANLSGFDGSPESMRKLQLEYGAEIAQAVVNYDGPLIFLVVSRYHGGAYVVFSQELNDSLDAMALTGSYASVIGGAAAAAVVFTREVRARAVADPRVIDAERALRLNANPEARDELDRIIADVRLEKQAELATEFDDIHSVERARDVGSLERIISPQQMRSELIGKLEAGVRAWLEQLPLRR